MFVSVYLVIFIYHSSHCICFSSLIFSPRCIVFFLLVICVKGADVTFVY